MAGEDIVMKGRIDVEVDQPSLQRAKSDLRGLTSGPGTAMAVRAAASGSVPTGLSGGGQRPMGLLGSGPILPPSLPPGPPPQLLLGSGLPGGGGGMSAAAEAATAGMNSLGSNTMAAATQAAELGKRTRNFYSMMTGNPFQVMGELAKRITGAQGFITRLDDAALEVGAARTALKAAAVGTAEYAAAEKRLVAATNEMTAATRAAGSARGKALGLATFGVQNLLTSVGLFGAFQLITMAFEGLVNIIDRAVNPAKYLREEISKVAQAAQSAGGGLARMQQLGLGGSSPLASQLNRISWAQQADEAVTGLVDILKTATADLEILTTDNARRLREALGVRGTAAGAVGETAANTYIARNLMFEQYGSRSGQLYSTEQQALASEEGQKAIQALAAENAQRFELIGYGKQYTATFQRLVNSGVSYANALDQATDQTIKSVLGTIALTSADTMLAGLRGQMLSAGMIGTGNTPVEKAQIAVTDAQKRLAAEQDRVSKINAANARRTQLDQARRNIGQAGVAGRGDTVFDVAQRIIDAQAAYSDTQQQTQYQGRIAEYSKAVAQATTDLSRAQIGDTAKNIEQYVKDIVPTLDSAQKAELKREIALTFAGTDKATKALAEALMLLLDAGIAPKKPGRDNY